MVSQSFPHRALLCALLSLLVFGCSSDDGPPAPGDVTPPAAVTNLAVAAVTDSTTLLVWTAPGDDGAEGTASSYDIRFSVVADSADSWWDSLTTVIDADLVPQAAGTPESLLVADLAAKTTYYFALMACDDNGNWSALSNVAEAFTDQPDDVPPSTVVDLRVAAVTSTSVQLAWTAPGDDGDTGEAASYDLRYATETITDENWSQALAVNDLPAPGAPGSDESITAWDLDPTTTYYFALKTSDEVPNTSALSNVVSASTLNDQHPPHALTALAAAAVEATAVELHWTAPGDEGAEGQAATYDLRYASAMITAENWDDATQTSGLPAPAAAGSDESFTVTELLAETTYYFALKTADEVPNWSAISNILEAHTSVETTPPATIDDLAVVAVTPSAVELSWTAPGDDGTQGQATSYDLRYAGAVITAENWDDATQISGLPDPAASGSAEGFTVMGLDSETTYHFAVKAADEVPNWSAISNSVPATTLSDQTAPAQILDLSVGAQTMTSLTLTWTAPGDDGTQGQASAYDLRYATATITTETWDAAMQASGEPAPAAAGSAETFLLDGLEEDVTYYVAVKAADEVPNWSPISNVLEATTDADATPPAAVSDLASVSVTPSSIEITWSAPGDDGSQGQASQYDVRYATETITGETWDAATQASGEPAPSAAGNAETLTIGDLDAGTTYYVALKTADEVPNWSSLSNVLAVATADEDVPPDDITDLSVGGVGTTWIQLTWTAPGDDGTQGQAEQYDLRYSTATITSETWDAATPVEGEPDPSTAGSVESHTVEGLDLNTTYYFAVKTADEVPNWSGLSNVASVTTLPEQVPPDAITDLTFGTFTATTVDLSWTAVGDDGAEGQATGYDIRHAQSPITEENWDSATSVDGEPTPGAPGTAEQFTVTELRAGTTHYFAIKTRDEVPNWSALSNVPSTSTPNQLFLIRPDGTGDRATIQDAVDASVDGDIIELTDGTFTGEGNRDVDLLGLDITIRSQNGFASACIIDCVGNAHHGFILQSGESAATIIEDITITGGYASGSTPDDTGGAILCTNGSFFTLTGCILTGNHAEKGGGIGFHFGAGATITDCTLSDNTTSDIGGAIYARITDALTLDACLLNNNTGGGIYFMGDGTEILSLTDCEVNENETNGTQRGGALHLNNGTITIAGCELIGNSASSGGAIFHFGEDGVPMEISECLIVGNRASSRGGGIFCDNGGRIDLTQSTLAGNYSGDQGGGIYCGNTGSPAVMTLVRTIVWWNCGSPNEEIYVGTGSSSIAFTCCNLNDPGIGGMGTIDHVQDNVYSIPRFCNPRDCELAPTTLGEYGLLPNSPCIPSHSPCGELIGAKPLGCAQ